jgi:hypothetical protein
LESGFKAICHGLGVCFGFCIALKFGDFTSSGLISGSCLCIPFGVSGAGLYLKRGDEIVLTYDGKLIDKFF